MSKKIDVSVILVNYKTFSYTKAAIHSIIEKTSSLNYEIIVIDNSCDTGEKVKLDSLSKYASVIYSKSNVGFGVANNNASLLAKGEYLFFLNTDTVLLNNSIFILYDFIRNNPCVGAVCPNLYNASLEPTHSFFKSKYTPFTLINKRFFPISFSKLFSKKRKDFNYKKKPVEIKGYICGAALMIRKELFKNIGGFSKDIFMYGEDVLLGGAINKKTNFKMYNIPSSKIMHLEGGSSQNGITQFKAYNMMRGRYLYFYNLYDKKTAIKAIQNSIAYYKKMKIICKIIKNKDSYERFEIMKKNADIILLEVTRNGSANT